MERTNSVSLGRIIWKILNNPLAANLTYDEAAEYATEAIGLLGVPVLYDKVHHEVTIKEHKGVLPNDIVYMEQVRDLTTGTGMRIATDSFHASNNQPEELRELTYEVKSGVIFTSFPEGCVEIAYKRLPVDEDGYPLIMNEEKLKMALEYYILHRYLEPLWMMGKISDKAFNHVSQERHYYMAAASTKLQMPSIDKMESLCNGINRLLINTNAHRDNFRLAGKKEIIKRHK
jgi:hypothetical protein